jgi:DNA-binding IclR family transcriptional regulator
MIRSVDHALRLAVVLQLEGSISVSGAADRLGVARSTAHRLLTMLVHRDFAVQEPDRTYGPGPVLDIATRSQSDVARLRELGAPRLVALTDAVGESTNLGILVGTNVRFVASAESTQALRVTSREGMAFPAHRTSVGLVLLAELEPDDVEQRYARAASPDAQDVAVDMDDLHRRLGAVRRQGYALNRERSELGVVAVGVPVRSPSALAVAGMAVSLPTARYRSGQLPDLLRALRHEATGLTRDLATRDG